MIPWIEVKRRSTFRRLPSYPLLSSSLAEEAVALRETKAKNNRITLELTSGVSSIINAIIVTEASEN